jgi:hypothetical protein
MGTAARGRVALGLLCSAFLIDVMGAGLHRGNAPGRRPPAGRRPAG